MSKEEYRLGDKASEPEYRHCRPDDIDWEYVNDLYGGQMTAKELAELLEISAIAVYSASYKGLIKLKYKYRSRR